MTDQEKINFIFNALEASKVSIKHFSEIVNVSRNTLHTWKRGANGYDSFRVTACVSAARRLNKAVEDGRLPLPKEVSAKEKPATLVRIIRSVVL